jgi:hypothetical protein
LVSDDVGQRTGSSGVEQDLRAPKQRDGFAVAFARHLGVAVRSIDVSVMAAFRTTPVNYLYRCLDVNH